MQNNRTYLTAHILFLCTLCMATEAWCQSKNARDFKVNTSDFYQNKGQLVDQNYKPNPAVKYLLCSPSFNVQLR